MLRGAADDPVAARCGGQVVEVAQGHLLAPRGIEQHPRKGAAVAVGRRRRHRPVERMARDVVADPARHQDRRVARGQPALQQRQLVLGLGLGPADDRHDPGQDCERLGRAAVFCHAPLQSGIGGLGALQFLHHRKDHIGGARRELEPRGRAAGLDDDRVALRRARDVDRPRDLEEPPLVVQRPDPRWVDVDARALVGDDRAVVPAIPQPAHDIDEFVRHLVAQIVVHVRSRLKLSAALASELVTTFHAARPFERWSIEAKVRAT